MMGTGAAAGPDASRGSVLVVDDERTIAEVVARYLERAGYQTRQAFAGPEAVAVALSWEPDLVVLDLMLPGFDGVEVLRRLRDGSGHGSGGHSGPAVIMLTARAEPSDRVAGLRRGADDYVVKPFSPAEIVARVDAVLRRSGAAHGGPSQQALEIDGLRIDPASRSVTVDGREVALTMREFELLAQLASEPGRVFTRDQLMELVWKSPAYLSTSTVTVHVRRLRAKLALEPGVAGYIETARGLGYRLRAPRLTRGTA